MQLAHPVAVEAVGCSERHVNQQCPDFAFGREAPSDRARFPVWKHCNALVSCRVRALSLIHI
eukprot:7285802-Alexandrium_andersonii.AAC.1